MPSVRLISTMPMIKTKYDDLILPDPMTELPHFYDLIHDAQVVMNLPKSLKKNL